MNTIESIFRSSDFFSHLSQNEQKKIARYSTLTTYENGDIVFSEGDPGNELYIVGSGEISISRITEEEKLLELARFIQGDLFGEMDFFQQGTRNATARAETESTLLRFPKEGYNFSDILNEYPAISAQLLHSFLTTIAGRIRNTNKLVTQNSPLVQELRKQVYGDKLTGLYNRSYLEEQLQSYLNEKNAPVSLLMAKPDNFKYINDTYGHEAGDQTLRILAGTYKNLIKPEDALVRFMGNEFGFVMTETRKADAAGFAKKLQKLVAGIDLSEVIGDDDFRLTLSVGIAVYPDYGDSATDIIELAHELPLIGRGRGGGRVLFPEDKEEGDT